MDIFVIKLLLAFLTGGIWVTLATIIAEKFGTKMGGVVAGIPSNLTVSLFFIGWTQSPEIASEATTIVPAILGVVSLFLAVQIFLSRYNFSLSIIASLTVWFVLSLGLLFLNFDNFIYSLLILAVLTPTAYYFVEKKLKIKSEMKKTIHYTLPQLLFRATLSGAMISFAVIIAKIAGPLYGGAFATFPALFLSTILITHISHGRLFSSAVMKAAMVSGAINCAIYAIMIRYSYLYLGLIEGTLTSLIVVLISSYGVYQFVSKRMI